LLEELGGRLERVESGGAGIAKLERAASRKRHRAYREAARTLCPPRAPKAAARLDAAVEGELKPLKLDAARFRTVVEPLDEAQWSRLGHGPGRVRSLDQSRRTVRAADQDRQRAASCRASSWRSRSRWRRRAARRTMIFDEIDRGVGGAVASAIGERLARLADTAQVLVVTHSPQVAARGARTC
jgi:DNA repair protein RecN (Recombination protein N)